jgi:hypothetical protein
MRRYNMVADTKDTDSINLKVGIPTPPPQPKRLMKKKTEQSQYR